MIIDKKSKAIISEHQKNVLALSDEPPVTASDVDTEEAQQVADGGPMDVLRAIKTILRSVTWKYGVVDSPKIFKTVQIDDGQYERIISASGNKEETMGFPAAFIHFIQWRYLTSQSRINEGRSELRIRFILNSLNVHEDEHDMDIYYVAERIHQTILENISNYECLQERCNLEYIDPMESFDDGLQPCWMTYEIWFKQENIAISRRKIYKKFVCPPFTNHADQVDLDEDANPDNHTNLEHTRTYDESTSYVKIIESEDESTDSTSS